MAPSPVETVGVVNTESITESVKIQWEMPDDGGSLITSYKILILESDGKTFSENKNACDGSKSAIISSRECTITVDSLTSAPFSLTMGAKVKVKVTATNSVGFSTSGISGSAIIYGLPDAPRYVKSQPDFTSQ